MQTKLVVASLAAVVHQASAVHSQASAQDAETPAAALMAIYSDCKAQIENLAVTPSTLGHRVKWNTVFDITGLTADCPDMVGKIWFEPPAFCKGSDECPEEGYDILLSIDAIKAGHVDLTMEQDFVAGDWYAHVSVTPAYFDCAMALTDACMLIEPPVPAPACEAKIKNLKALASINDAVGDETYNGADGMMSTMTWNVDNIWDCGEKLCSDYSLLSEDGVSTFTGAQSWSQIYTHYQGNGQAEQFTSYTTYSKLSYSVNLKDCSSDKIYDTQTVVVENPHKPCSATSQGTLKINTMTDDMKCLTINQQFANTVGYSCEGLDLVFELSNMGVVSGVVPVANTDQPYTTTVCDQDFGWDNLPIAVDSQVKVTGKWKQVEMDYVDIYTVQVHEDYDKECNFAVYLGNIKADIITGADASSHKMDITTNVFGSYGDYCPDFSGEVIWSHAGKQVESYSLTEDEVKGLYQAGQTMTKSGSATVVKNVPFNDGQLCAQFVMTPDATKGNMAASKKSEPFCVEITAPACTLTADSEFEIDLDEDLQELTFMQLAKYTADAWCAADNLSFSYLYRVNDGAWIDAQGDQHVGDYQGDLKSANQITSTWKEPDHDVKIHTHFKVTHSPKWSTQSEVSAESFADDENIELCRPLIDTSKVTVDLTNGLDVTVGFQTVTDGGQNCKSMYADIEVMELPDKTVVGKVQLDNDAVAKFAWYENYTTIETTTVTIPETPGCYQVKITYGEVGGSADTAVYTTGEYCYHPTCELGDPTLTYKSRDPSADGNSYDVTFDLTASWNVYCSFLTADVSMAGNSGVYSAPQIFVQHNYDMKISSSSIVIQTGDFTQQHFVATLVVKGSGNRQKTVTTNVIFTGVDPSDCKHSLTNSASFFTDTLTKVQIDQAITGSVGAICGASSVMMSLDGTNTDWISTNSKSWNVKSVSGDYKVGAKAKFANVEDEADLGEVVLSWRQGCLVAVDEVTIVSFRAADNDTQTTAAANLQASGTKTGDCGDSFVFTATLTSENGDVAQVPITAADFFSEAGASATIEIERFVQHHLFSLKVVADKAPSVAQHQAQTSAPGYVQVNEATGQSANKKNIAPECNVVMSSLSFQNMKGGDVCADTMSIVVDGSITTEKACNQVAASVSVWSEDSQSMIKVDVAAPVTKVTDTEYTFTTTVSMDNLQDSFLVKGFAFDGSDTADVSSMKTALQAYQPACCLSIPKFAKASQQTSLDGTKADLVYDLQLATHGDNACHASSAKVSMTDSAGKTTFIHYLSGDDITSALSENGFSYTVSLATSAAHEAHIEWDDDLAVAKQNADADGWVDDNSVDCKVNVVDFCLDAASAVSDGRWSFEFTIRAEANSKCGSLSTELELIHEGNYLGHITIPDNAIVDSFNCDCTKTFKVEADFTGVAGEVYGQLDIRNSAHQVVQLMDSCVYTIA